MKVWALVSQKGGAGRSTLATQLSAYACQIGEKTVVIDLDPQGSALAWHAIRGSGESPAVIPCLPEKLSKLVEAIRSNGLATMVIIDTAPHTDKGAIEAISTADLIICPIRYGMFDTKSLEATVSLITMADAKGRAIGVVNAIKEAKKTETSDVEEVSARIERHGIRVAAKYLKDRRRYAEAVAEGKGVTEKVLKKNQKPDAAAQEIQDLYAELQETWPVVVPEGVA
jgi:chromosome partitioning protein